MYMLHLFSCCQAPTFFSILPLVWLQLVRLRTNWCPQTLPSENIGCVRFFCSEGRQNAKCFALFSLEWTNLRWESQCIFTLAFKKEFYEKENVLGSFTWPINFRYWHQKCFWWNCFFKIFLYQYSTQKYWIIDIWKNNYIFTQFMHLIIQPYIQSTSKLLMSMPTIFFSTLPAHFSMLRCVDWRYLLLTSLKVTPAGKAFAYSHTNTEKTTVFALNFEGPPDIQN